MVSFRRRVSVTAIGVMLAAGLFAGCAPGAESTPAAAPTEGPTETVPASAIDPYAHSDGTLEYESRAGGFRLTYPAEWSVDRSQQTAVAIEFPIAIGGVLGVRAGFFIIGAPLAEVGVTDLDGLWASFSESLSATATLDPRSSYEIGGQTGYQARFVDTEIQAQGWLITVISGGQGYVIIVMVQPPVHFETFQPVFEDMLGSVELFVPAPVNPDQP